MSQAVSRKVYIVQSKVVTKAEAVCIMLRLLMWIEITLVLLLFYINLQVGCHLTVHALPYLRSSITTAYGG